MSKIFTDEQIAQMEAENAPKENKVLKATMGNLLNPAEKSDVKSDNPYPADTGFTRTTIEELNEAKTYSISIRLSPKLYKKYCLITKLTTGQSFTSAIQQHMRETVNEYEDTHLDGDIKR